MHTIVSKVDRVLFEGEATSLHAPATDGEITVLPRHAPMVTTLRRGKVTIIDGEGKHDFEIVTLGVLEVASNAVTVLIA